MLQSGTRLGPYEIIAPIGAGGMGEVYRAHDAKLGRDVAIKILPHALTNDRDRLARFEREARLLAALNHPHIAAIYGIEDAPASGVGQAVLPALILELVEGVTLADRVRSGRIPVSEAVTIARQIAEALEAAHEKGIIHRDLKPANIKVTPNGDVKVLDFGLAKIENDFVTSDLSQSPTLTIGGTRQGVILGTAAYMSPEQARGMPVDKRADIWAFGCVLFELLAGHSTFARDTTTDTLAAIITGEPQWSDLPAATPPDITRLLRRCLEPDSRQRLRDIGEARIILETASRASGEVSADRELRSSVERPSSRAKRSLRSNVTSLGAAIVMGVAGFAVAAWWPVPPSEPPRIVPFINESELQLMPRWSPKGDRLAYVAAVDGVLQLFTRSIGSAARTQITHEAESCLNPMWSADSSRLFYLTGKRPNTSLRSIAVAGGVSTLVLDDVYRADLSPDGTLMAVLVEDAPGSYRLALSSPPGTAPKPYTQGPLAGFRDPGTLTALRFNNRGTYLGLFTNARSPVEFWKIPVNGAAPQEMLGGRLDTAGHFVWLPDDDGILTDSYVGGEPHLQAIRFGSGTRRVVTNTALRDATPSVSPDGGMLAFAAGELGYDIIEVPVNGGGPHDVIATARDELAPASDRDSRRFAYVTDRNNEPEVWLHDEASGSDRLIVSSKELAGVNALFDCDMSPDGSRLAYRAHLGGDVAIWISPLSGEAPVRMWDDPARSPQRGPSWSPDGNWIAYYSVRDGRPAVLKARVGAQAPPQFLANMARNQPVRWSPRGDWLAFRDGDTLRIVRPDGTDNQVISARVWETYGWSKDGASILGIGYGDNRRLVLKRVDMASRAETSIGDVGPVPAAFDLAEDSSQFPYRGFSLRSDGKSFLTAVYRSRMQIYLIRGFARPFRFIDQWWNRP